METLESLEKLCKKSNIHIFLDESHNPIHIPFSLMEPQTSSDEKRAALGRELGSQVGDTSPGYTPSTFPGPSKNIKCKTLLPAFAARGTACSVLGGSFYVRCGNICTVFSPSLTVRP